MLYCNHHWNLVISRLSIYGWHVAFVGRASAKRLQLVLQDGDLLAVVVLLLHDLPLFSGQRLPVAPQHFGFSFRGALAGNAGYFPGVRGRFGKDRMAYSTVDAASSRLSTSWVDGCVSAQKKPTLCRHYTDTVHFILLASKTLRVCRGFSFIFYVHSKSGQVVDFKYFLTLF